jgi:alanine dehydrogenase
MGMGAKVTVVARNREKMARLAEELCGRIRTVISSPENIHKEISDADLVIGAVLVPGDRAPLLVTRRMLDDMEPGSVIVDVAIDQGGCFETSRPTTHNQPVFLEAGIIHYCVANMPGAVPRTATHALTAATLPFIGTIAALGVERAVNEDPALYRGVNTWDGLLVNHEIARAQGLGYNDLSELLKI